MVSSLEVRRKPGPVYDGVLLFRRGLNQQKTLHFTAVKTISNDVASTSEACVDRAAQDTAPALKLIIRTRLISPRRSGTLTVVRRNQ
jgi:hypothetical protein